VDEGLRKNSPPRHAERKGAPISLHKVVAIMLLPKELEAFSNGHQHDDADGDEDRNGCETE